MPFPTHGQMPGVYPITETEEKQIWYGRETDLWYLSNPRFAAAAVDAGNTPTTSLRAGLLVGRITSTGLLTAWNHDATTGEENLVGVLKKSFSTLDGDATAVIKEGAVIGAGRLKAAQLLIEGVAFQGHANEYLARQQLYQLGIWLDDDLQRKYGPSDVLLRTAGAAGPTRTVTAAENGTLFLATGACTFTLPTLAPGLCYGFFNQVDADMVVASAVADTIIALNDLAADSLAFSTMSEKIGGFLVFRTYDQSAKWFVEDRSPGNTITVAS